jgi:hypothetical protein
MDDPPPFQHTRVLTPISATNFVDIIKDWNIEHRLGEINMPTLLTAGRHDEATKTGAVVHDNIPGSEWVVFKDSAHMAHAEEIKIYLEIVDNDTERALRFWQGVVNVEFKARKGGEGEGWQTRSDAAEVGVHKRGPGRATHSRCRISSWMTWRALFNE